MKVEQISVFLENKSGRLSEVTRLLGDAKVNIRALTLADTTDFGSEVQNHVWSLGVD